MSVIRLNNIIALNNIIPLTNVIRLTYHPQDLDALRRAAFAPDSTPWPRPEPGSAPDSGLSLVPVHLAELWDASSLASLPIRPTAGRAMLHAPTTTVHYPRLCAAPTSRLHPGCGTSQQERPPPGHSTHNL